MKRLNIILRRTSGERDVSEAKSHQHLVFVARMGLMLEVVALIVDEATCVWGSAKTLLRDTFLADC